MRKGEIRGDGNVKVRRETKGRGGKTVTTVTGLALTKDGLRTLLSDLKRLVGGGGTEKDGALELQGDHCDLVLAELAKRGIKAKRAGG
jgi:translation initiation factor 1